MDHCCRYLITGADPKGIDIPSTEKREARGNVAAPLTRDARGEKRQGGSFFWVERDAFWMKQEDQLEYFTPSYEQGE